MDGQQQLRSLFDKCTDGSKEYIDLIGLEKLWEMLGLPVIPRQHSSNIKSMFARIDTNNDGQATFSNLLENLPAVLQLADSLAEVADTTDSPDDSDSAFQPSQPEPEPESGTTVSRTQARRMRAIFDGCDVDGDGMLSAPEVEELLFRLDVAPIRGRRGKALRRRESVCGLLSELEPQQAVDYDQFQTLMLKALSRRSDGGFDIPSDPRTLSRTRSSRLSHARMSLGTQVEAPLTPRISTYQEPEEKIVALQNSIADYEIETSQLREKVKQMGKDQQHFQNAAQEQLDQAESTMETVKRAAAARLKAELRALRLQKDDEITALKLKFQNSSNSLDKDSATNVSLLKSITSERAQLALEVDSLMATIVEATSKTEDTQRQSERTIFLLTEELDEYREALQKADANHRENASQLLEASEHIQRLQDINDELRMSRPLSRPSSRMMFENFLSPDGPKFLSDELEKRSSSRPSSRSSSRAGSRFTFDEVTLPQPPPQPAESLGDASESGELERAYKRISKVEIEKKELVQEMAEFSQINEDLRKFHEQFQLERNEAHRLGTENETLKYMYKELRAASASQDEYKKLQQSYQKLKNIYSNVKFYATELEQNLKLQDLRVKTVELELVAAKQAANTGATAEVPDTYSTPGRGMPSPKTPRTSNRTLQTVIDVQEARMAEYEAGKEMAQWKLSVVQTELKRKEEEAASVTKKLAAAENREQDTVAQLAVVAGLSPSKGTAVVGGCDDGSNGSPDRAPVINLGPVMVAEQIRGLEAANDELTDQNVQLAAKVDRLQQRLQRFSRYNPMAGTPGLPPPSPMPQAPVDELDRLIADFEDKSAAAPIREKEKIRKRRTLPKVDLPTESNAASSGGRKANMNTSLNRSRGAAKKHDRRDKSLALMRKVKDQLDAATKVARAGRSSSK